MFTEAILLAGLVFIITSAVQQTPITRKPIPDYYLFFGDDQNMASQQGLTSYSQVTDLPYMHVADGITWYGWGDSAIMPDDLSHAGVHQEIRQPTGKYSVPEFSME